MQANLKDALSDKYGAERDFPGWTAPFLHAVGILDKLGSVEEHLTEKKEARDLDRSIATGVKLGLSKEVEGLEGSVEKRDEKAEANLISVSRSVLLCKSLRMCSSNLS